MQGMLEVEFCLKRKILLREFELYKIRDNKIDTGSKNDNDFRNSAIYILVAQRLARLISKRGGPGSNPG
jgi:hypothetical protein